VKNPSVIIIKKVKKGGHSGHHGGAWKVAYADFVTAMMAFFLVMWLVAQSNAVKAAIAGYFKDPGVFDYEKSTGMIPGGDQAPLNPDQPPQLRDRPKPVTPEEGIKALEDTAKRIHRVLENMPEFKKLGKQIKMEVTPEGLRIELMEGDQDTFFDSGSAQLKGDTERLLAAIASELGRVPNDIVLEGHTDATPYSAANGYSNWELSADRANAARRIMERFGVNAHQVKGVRGYSATRPRVPENPVDPRNRRVSIVVVSNFGALDAPGGTPASSPEAAPHRGDGSSAAKAAPAAKGGQNSAPAH
jgi:chemotaxis protein MotB